MLFEINLIKFLLQHKLYFLMITTLKKNWQNILPAFRKIGIKNNDNEETRLRKSILINTTLMITFAGILWGSFYIIFNEKIAGSFPLVYSILSTINIIILITTQNFRFFRFTQLLLTILLPFLLMITLGGFIKGSVVMLWGLLAPIGALLCDNSRHARYWFFTYIILLIICGIVQPYLGFNNNLPQNVITIFFVVNIGAVSTISFTAARYS